MGLKGFTSSGIVVGQTRRSRRDQKVEQLKGNKVTMGNNVPHQSEGRVGDITVREVSSIGLICYIKTNSGWYDINTMQSATIAQWTNVAYHATANWEDYDSDNAVQYTRDPNGLVHLRGQAKTGSAGDAGANDTIFTLPSTFRPIVDTSRIVVTGGLQHLYYSTLRIQQDGRADMISSVNTTQTAIRVVFDGISFFAGQTVIGSGAGSSSSNPAGSGSGGGGSGSPR